MATNYIYAHFGEEGSGKSVLATSVYEQLQTEGFNVAFVEPATSKQMLLEIAEQLGVETQNLEGKALTTDQLKRAIACEVFQRREEKSNDGHYPHDN